jgi:hypothetical protein
MAGCTPSTWSSASRLLPTDEEIVFRRCARHVFQIYLNDGYALVAITSILFGAITGGQALEILSRLC